MDPAIEGLEPVSLWKHFDELTKIPHGSGNESSLRGAIADLARARGLEVRIDPTGNLLIRIPATPGHESADTAVLQAHLDMVCEKNDDVDHDFAIDPIRLHREGDWLKARGTTLGADNGIGVAAALAMMDEPGLVHPPLELLFTVEEETGLIGATGLSTGFIHGSRLLNLDSENLGVATIGCAGGKDVSTRIPIALSSVAPEQIALQVRVGGLVGGHSGIDIHLNRGNAIRILADYLGRLLDRHIPFGLASLSGGNQRNAIPREARAVIVLEGSDLETATSVAQAVQADGRAMAGKSDPDLVVSVQAVPVPPAALPTPSSIVRTLQAVPSGVLAMSQEIPGLVETSNNLGVLRMDGDAVTVICAPRSSVDASLDITARSLAALFQLASGDSAISMGYPGWRPDPDSTLVQVIQRVHRRLFSSDVQLEACHAGLECGVLGQKVPGMQMISIGPTIMAPHSPDERVQVSSVTGFWSFLAAVLEELA